MDKRLKYLLIGLFIIALLWMLYYIQTVIAYILISAVVGMIGRPLVWKLKKVRIGGKQIFSDTTGAAIVLVFFLVLIVNFIGLIVPVIIEEANTIANISQHTSAEDTDGPIYKLGEKMQKVGMIPTDAHPRGYLVGKIKDAINMDAISVMFSNFIGSMGSILMGLFSVLFISFYFLQDSRIITSAIFRFTPRKDRETTAQMMRKIKDALQSYFLGLVIEMLIVGFLIWLGMSILGVKHAVVIGFFAGVINIIPYLGPWIGGSFALSIGFISNLENGINAEMGTLLVSQLIVVAVVQLIDNFILQPRIYSKSVGAHPLEIFIIILIGGTLGGIIGMIIAVPTYTFIRIVAYYFFEDYSFAQFITASMRKAEVSKEEKS
ncbi:MAG: AI-2E family transporter [Crocinitomicaceae bacterium]